MRTLRTLLLATLAASTAVALMLPSASAAEVEVGVGLDNHQTGTAHLRYFPETIVVWEGDTVTWNAVSDTPHTVTAVPAGGPPAYDSSPALRQDDPTFAAWFGPGGFLMPSQRFNQTFEEEGTFAYFCKIHPGMVGTITVVNATDAEDAEGPVASGYAFAVAGWGSGDTSVDRFAPAHLTVTNGTTVEWVNLHSDEPHTVTAVPAGGPPAFDSSPEVGRPPEWFEGPEGVMTPQGANTRFQRVFDEEGHYQYFCKLHPGMRGTVVVLAKPEAADSGAGGNAGDGDGAGSGGGSTGRNPSTGSTIPGPPLGIALAGLGLLALAARRVRA